MTSFTSGSHCAKRKRPEPTGARPNGDWRSESCGTLPSRCSGWISIWYVASKNCSGLRRLNQKTAVSESRTETESMFASSGPNGAPVSGSV